MTRPSARITYDEVTRLVKAVSKGCSLPIRRVTFDGSRVEVVIENEDIGDSAAAPLVNEKDDSPLLREPAE